MIYSLRTLNRKSSFVVLYLFFLFFGMAFTTGSGKTNENLSDSSVYRLRFEQIALYDFNQYLIGLKEYFSFQEKKDYFFDTLSFILTRFTDNYHFLFLSVSIIFAYFMLRSLSFLVKDVNYKTSTVGLLLVLFFLYIDIFNINGIRFWTTYWIATYCVFQIYAASKPKYWLLVLITPLFHIAYLAFVLLMIAFRVVSKKQKTLIIFFLISVFLGFLSLSFLEWTSKYLPSVLQKMIVVYTSEGQFESNEQISSLGGKIQNILNYAKFGLMNFMVYLLILNKEEIGKTSQDNKVFAFILFWIGIFNIFYSIPSFGSRFIVLGYPLLAYLWLRLFGVFKYKWVVLLIPVVLFWDIRLKLNSFERWQSIDFLYTNPILIIYKYLVVPPL